MALQSTPPPWSDPFKTPRPKCPCEIFDCDHLWCRKHQHWANDTGLGVSCCPKGDF